MILRFASAIDTQDLPHVAANRSELNIILGLVFGVAGTLAVLMIVISGFRYVIARGDPQATASARNGLIYALIGLLVTVSAFGIVTFAINILK